MIKPSEIKTKFIEEELRIRKEHENAQRQYQEQRRRFVLAEVQKFESEIDRQLSRSQTINDGSHIIHDMWLAKLLSISIDEVLIDALNQVYGEYWTIRRDRSWIVFKPR